MKSRIISLSLIVPTIGREQYLIRLLDSFCAQTRKDFEVIIVDQSEHPESVGVVLEKYTPQLSIKHIVQKEKGAAKARNEGVRHADGEILAWPDDDCWYENSVVENALEKFSSPAPSVLIGCPLTEGGNLYNRWIPKYETKAAVQDILNFGIEWSIFMQKNVFLRANGFDPRIGQGSGTIWYAGESSDLCLRILSFDKNLLYSPSVRIHHPQSRSKNPDASQKAFRYAYGMGALCRKNASVMKAKDLAGYFWSYLRAFCWAMLRFNVEDIHYHFLRMRGFVQGYWNFLKENIIIGDPQK